MNYSKALEYIRSVERFGSKLGLDSTRRLLELLGNPHKGLKYVHIAGTNGKGSVVSYIGNMLMETGCKVGVYTSPYLEVFNDRIQINNKNISDEDLTQVIEQVKEKSDYMIKYEGIRPTSFEIITAAAFLYFSNMKVDYVVLEVGLGGRIDSTNVIESSLASVITTIDMDHMDILGDTLGKIAYEKAGIIKEGGLVISYPQKEEALNVIKKVAQDKNAELILCSEDNVSIKSTNDEGAVFDYNYSGHFFKDLNISLLGRYQVFNASLALTTIVTLRDRKFLEIGDEQIRRGLKNTKWKGRMEVLRRNPIFLIDGAHNPQGALSLRESIKLFKYKRLILGIGILKDKDVDSVIKDLVPMADMIIITEPNGVRKMEAEELAEKIRNYSSNIYVEKDIHKAVDYSLKVANPDDMILFSGSLYLVGDVRDRKSVV